MRFQQRSSLLKPYLYQLHFLTPCCANGLKRIPALKLLAIATAMTRHFAFMPFRVLPYTPVHHAHNGFRKFNWYYISEFCCEACIPGSRVFAVAQHFGAVGKALIRQVGDTGTECQRFRHLVIGAQVSSPVSVQIHRAAQ